MKRITTSVLFLLSLTAMAQTPILPPDYSQASKVAPAYFGPNAFPVPDIPDGKAHGSILVEVAGDYYKGFIADGSDHSYDGFVRISAPLFTKRARLEIWMPVMEFWDFSPAVAAARNIPSPDSKERWKGHDTGDIYIGTNIHALYGKANSFRPDILVRAVLKTASGNAFSEARFHDAAGYYFDATFIWSRAFPQGFVRELRGGLTAGFLCWQTGTARQNDAVQYGLLGIVDTRFFRFTADWAGYVGWERDGDHSRRVRLRLDGHTGLCSPFFQYILGTNDYPFHGFRAGVVFNIKTRL